MISGGSRSVPGAPGSGGVAGSGSAPGNRGLTLIELLVVIAILAAVAGAVLSTTGEAEERVAVQLAWKEMHEIREALVAFHRDTGVLPLQGRFAPSYAPGGEAWLAPPGESPSAAWAEHPANLSQLLLPPADASGYFLLPWNRSTGRGWRGPYLRDGHDGRLSIAPGLQPDGSGASDPSGVWLHGIPAVADPFTGKVRLAWSAWTPAPGGSSSARLERGAPYLVFDLDNLWWARIVSCGPNGIYESSGLADRDTEAVVETGDDLVLFLFR